MIIWILVTALLTPWFWSLQTPANIFTFDLQKDIVEAKSVVTWERGKVSHPALTDKLFLNWPAEVINQRVAIVMENIDIGNYFFANHPRERVGINERQKFFFFQFILLFIGLTNAKLKKHQKWLMIYTSVVLLTTFLFKWRTFEQTLPLALPLIVLIALGFEKLFKSSPKYIAIFIGFAVLEILSFL